MSHLPPSRACHAPSIPKDLFQFLREQDCALMWIVTGIKWIIPEFRIAVLACVIFRLLVQIISLGNARAIRLGIAHGDAFRRATTAFH